jgi:hypothetical protein
LSSSSGSSLDQARYALLNFGWPDGAGSGHPGEYLARFGCAQFADDTDRSVEIVDTVRLIARSILPFTAPQP